MEHFHNLLINAALLVVMGFFYSRTIRFFKKQRLLGQFVNGLMFGAITIAVMYFPAYFMPGLIFDTRSIMISISGFFGGPISAIISIVIAASYRIWLGGVGITPGVITIVSSGTLGVSYYYLKKKYPFLIKPLYIFIFGLIVHICVLLCMFTLPWGTAMKVLQAVSLPIITIFPVASFIIISLMLDKAARIKAEDSLKEREKNYRELLTNLSTGIIINAPDTRIIFCNQQAANLITAPHAELLGCNAKETGELINRTSKAVFVSKDNSILTEDQHPVKIVLQTRQPLTEYIVGIKREENNTVWIMINAFPEYDNNGKLSQIVSTLTDITKEREIHEALKASEEQLRITLNSIGDGVIATDVNSHVVRMNPEAERLTGWKMSAAAGKPLKEIFDIVNAKNPAVTQNPVDKVLASGNVIGLGNHTILRSKDGNEYQIADSGAPIRDDDGNITGVIMIFRDVTEDYRIHEEVKRNESLLSHVSKLAKVGGWQLDIASGDVIWTKGLYEIMEMSPDSAVPKIDKHNDFFTPEFRKKAWQHMRRHIKEDSPLDFETKIKTVKGNIKWCRILGNKIFQGGKCTGIYGALQDISDSKRAEENIINLSKFPDEDPFPVMRTDKDGKLLYVNKSSQPLLSFWNIDPNGVLPQIWRERIAKAHADKKITRYEIEYSNITVLMAITPIAGTDYVNIYGFDISERKKNLEELNRIKTLLDEIQTVAEIGGWEVDFEHNTHTWTKENYLIHETTPEEYTPTIESAIDFYTPKSQPVIKKAVDDAIKLGKEFDLELDIITAKGKRKTVHTSSKIIRKDNKTIRMLGAFQDISEQKKNEMELKNALIKAEEASRTKNEFLATMSHEIRTPLNGIMGFAEILENSILKLQIPERKKLMDYLEIVISCGKNVNELINDILELSSLESGKNSIEFEKFSPSKIIMENIEIFRFKAREKGLYLEFEHGLLPTTVNGARHQFRQIIFNLIGNAVKFTNTGGVTVRANYHDGSLLIEIKDTGIGIPAKAQKRILEPFTQADQSSTRKYSGTGLGLTIVSKSLEDLGGSFKIKSKEGEGTSISFTFPAVVSEDYKLKTKIADKQRKDLNLLVIEDNEISILYLNEILESSGMNYKIAETFSKMKKICAQGFIPDVVLLDISLPDADGVECAKWLHNKFADKDFKCIVQTAHVLKEDIKNYEAEFDDYIGKPYKKEELLEIINRNL